MRVFILSSKKNLKDPTTNSNLLLYYKRPHRDTLCQSVIGTLSEVWVGGRTTGPGPRTTLDLTHVRHIRLYNLVVWTIKFLNVHKSHNKRKKIHRKCLGVFFLTLVEGRRDRWTGLVPGLGPVSG
jgi:hypothetical protein